MYGQTGSGKTFTTLGENSIGYQSFSKKSMESLQKKNNNIGILILSLNYLIQQISQDHDKTYILRCAYYEIYNEQIYDLLDNNNQFEIPLVICEDTTKKDFYIRGLQEESVSSLQDILQIIQKGEEKRHYA